MGRPAKALIAVMWSVGSNPTLSATTVVGVRVSNSGTHLLAPLRPLAVVSATERLENPSKLRFEWSNRDVATVPP